MYNVQCFGSGDAKLVGKNIKTISFEQKYHFILGVLKTYTVPQRLLSSIVCTFCAE